MSQLVFPLDRSHNHASCILELPNGELLLVWYRGSGEHEADDVMIMGARKRQEDRSWTRPFVMIDTANFPDANPIIFLDRQRRLWLVWSLIVANDWRTSILKYRVATDYRLPQRVPKWQFGDIFLFGAKEFAEDVNAGLVQLADNNMGSMEPQHIERIMRFARDKHASRIGWIARSRPIHLPTGRVILPIYSDGLSFSMMAISDDDGESWYNSKPIVGLGNIQPTLVRKNDGTLVAYMRNAGLPPNRLQMSISKDEGQSWTPPTPTSLPNPNSAAEVIRLSNGDWAMVYNDIEQGRHRLAVSISGDEGESWRWTQYLERDNRDERAGQFHYPSIIQTQDGLIHVSYSFFLDDSPPGEPSKSIKHVTFNLEWVKAEKK